MCKFVTISKVEIEPDSKNNSKYIVKVFSSGKSVKIIGENLTYTEALEKKREWDELLKDKKN